MTEVLPLTLPVLTGCGCDCASHKDEGGETGEMHCGGPVV